MAENKSRYVFWPAIPVLAILVIVVFLAASGTFLWVWSQDSTRTFTLIACIVFLVLALVLAGMATYQVLFNRVFFELDDVGYVISGRKKVQGGKWAEVTKVTQTNDGMHIIIHLGETRRTHLLIPKGSKDQALPKLLQDMAARLDANRGYRPFE